jgi:hypothetical protein
MALFINNQNDQRSQLQERIAAELQEKARIKAELANLPDGVDDSAYIKDTKQTTTLAWVWILIVFVVIGLIIGLTINSTR